VHLFKGRRHWPALMIAICNQIWHLLINQHDTHPQVISWYYVTFSKSLMSCSIMAKKLSTYIGKMACMIVLISLETRQEMFSMNDQTWNNSSQCLECPNIILTFILHSSVSVTLLHQITSIFFSSPRLISSR